MSYVLYRVYQFCIRWEGCGLHIAVHAVAFQSYTTLQHWLYIQISATFMATLFPSAFSITDKNYKVTGWHNLVYD